MTLKEIAVEEFTNFVKESPLGTYYQTREYALLMGNYGYDYDFIGMYDEYNNLKSLLNNSAFIVVASNSSL